MKSIQYKDYNFKKMTILKDDEDSQVYHNNKYVYKINKTFDENLLRYSSLWNIRLTLLSPIKIENCLFPNAKIKQGMKLVGSRTPYVKGFPLSEFFYYHEELYLYLKIVYDASLKQQEIHAHPAKIVIGDTNFSNILYNENLETYLIDFEDCGVGFISPSACSAAFDNYCKVHGSTSPYKQEFDNFSFFLDFLEILFYKKVEEITEYEIDSLREKSESIANIKKLILYIQKSHGIYKIPYLYEMLSSKDFQNQELILKRR